MQPNSDAISIMYTNIRKYSNYAKLHVNKTRNTNLVVQGMKFIVTSKYKPALIAYINEDFVHLQNKRYTIQNINKTKKVHLIAGTKGLDNTTGY